MEKGKRCIHCLDAYGAWERKRITCLLLVLLIYSSNIHIITKSSQIQKRTSTSIHLSTEHYNYYKDKKEASKGEGRKCIHNLNIQLKKEKDIGPVEKKRRDNQWPQRWESSELENKSGLKHEAR